MQQALSYVFVAVFATSTAIQADSNPVATGGRSAAPGPGSVADVVLAGIGSPELRDLVAEALERNPGIRAGLARARAAAQRAPQVRALPDPTAEATAFLLPPETRVGAQRFIVGLHQPLPWLAKLDLRKSAAVWEALAEERGVESERLSLITEVRRIYFELLFVDSSRSTTNRLLEDLARYEEVALTRYATGVGSTQAVLKLQAEITRGRSDLVDLMTRESTLRARLNALRDRPVRTPAARGGIPVAIGQALFDSEALLDQARSSRPEIQAAAARLEQAEAIERLARMARRPDFSVGLTWTFVTARDDPAARVMPPPDNGRDVFGLRGGVTLPLARRSRSAAIAEALEHRTGAVDARRAAELAVESEVGELVERLPQAWTRLRLLEDLLLVQAEEGHQAAEAGYLAGTFAILDLIDVERLLRESQTALDRARVDYLIGLAELEGAVGAPLAASASDRGGER